MPIAQPAATVSRGWVAAWLLLGVPAFAAGWASAQAMGEVVGEAWGGDFLHQLGHAIGSVLLMGLVSLAGWVALRGRVAWATRWALATTLGSVAGFAAFVPVLAWAPHSLTGLTIAFTLHIPLAASAVAQAWALRSRLAHPVRWGFAWYAAVLFGVAVAWFSGGGVAGAHADAIHPVLPEAAKYWAEMVPRSLLGGAAYAVASLLLLRRRVGFAELGLRADTGGDRDD